MGDTSDGTSGDGAAGRGWLARSWVGRHWRGELGLAKAFWLNGILFNVAGEIFGGAISHLTGGLSYSWQRDLAVIDVCAVFAGMPLFVVLGLGPFFIIMALTTVLRIWQIIGIARSADRYPGWCPGEGRRWNDASRRLFAFAARAVMAVWVATLAGLWIALAVGPSNQ
ncbi:MAG: hypothetical protein IH626_05535 [Rhodospirillales bacterium]|nr:hypothetical protein [Rhodospirillales bacterium]